MLLLDVGFLMALCFAAWGFFYTVLFRRFQIDYTRRFGLTTLYYLAVGLLPLLAFWNYLKPLLIPISIDPLLVLAGFMLLQIGLSVFFARTLRHPNDYLEAYPDRYYLKLNWRRYISKSADIFAQQVIIILLVLLLERLGLSLLMLIIAFGTLFMLLHVPLIMSEWGAWPSALFASIVVVFSVLFPELILFVRYGFIYNIILHWAFYTITAATFWLQYNGYLTKQSAAKACAYLGLCLLVLAFALLLVGSFSGTLFALVCVVLLMEVRVRLGFRLSRGLLFYMHLSAGVLLGAALLRLLFVQNEPLHIAAFALFAVVAATGGTLLIRNLIAHG